MSRYVLEVLPAARRQVKKLSPQAYRQVQPVIRSLAENPRPHGYKPLQGNSKVFTESTPETIALFTKFTIRC